MRTADTTAFRAKNTSKKASIGFILLSFFLTFNSSAQHKPTLNIGLAAGTSSYSGALGNGIGDMRWKDLAQNRLGALTIGYYLSPSFDAELMASYGTWGFYFPAPPYVSFKGKMTHAHLRLKYKLNNDYFIPQNSIFGPFLFAGAGVSSYTGRKINEGMDYPLILGWGLRLGVTNSLGLFYSATGGLTSTRHYHPSSEGETTASGHDLFVLHTAGIDIQLHSRKYNMKYGKTRIF